MVGIITSGILNLEGSLFQRCGAAYWKARCEMLLLVSVLEGQSRVITSEERVTPGFLTEIRLERY